MKEIWKDIKNYEGFYKISNLGRVKSLGNGGSHKKERIMKAGNVRGYLQLGLRKDGTVKHFYVHRLVAEAFLDNPDNLPEINHKDENKANNCVDNLEWCDRTYNITYGTLKHKFCKPIVQSDLNDNVIKVWQSLCDVQKELGYNKGNIGKCCNNKEHYHTAYGFKWNYL